MRGWGGMLIGMAIIVAAACAVRVIRAVRLFETDHRIARCTDGRPGDARIPEPRRGEKCGYRTYAPEGADLVRNAEADPTAAIAKSQKNRLS